MATYVLIHGAWHGGWCFDRLAPLMRAAGHVVLAPDLPGHGEDKTPVAEVTLDAYAARICEVAGAQTEPVILVGHSMGGAAISQAAERCPQSISKLVYLTAFLLPHGGDVFTMGTSDPGADLPRYLRPDPAAGTMTVAEEGITPSFYHDCPEADIAFAKARLVPQALAPASTPLALTDARFGRVPRVYIECTDDRAITITTQRAMYGAMPCERVISLPTGHSPFFSATADLAAHLVSLA